MKLHLNWRLTNEMIDTISDVDNELRPTDSISLQLHDLIAIFGRNFSFDCKSSLRQSISTVESRQSSILAKV